MHIGPCLPDDMEEWLVAATIEWRSDLGGWVAILEDPRPGGVGWIARQGDERRLRQRLEAVQPQRHPAPD